MAKVENKVNKVEKQKETRPTATAKHIRISSSKLRIVMNLVRGKRYADAVAILSNSPNKAADIIKEVVVSAAANGENNMGLNKADMFVAEIYACDGPLMKRQNIRARGRVDRILKRTSHLTVVLDTVKE